MPSGSSPRLSGRRSLAIACLLYSLVIPFTAVAAEQAFIVTDIVVRGVERVEKGTVLTYVPVRAGERFELKRDTGRVIRGLYESGSFDDVKLSHDGGVLIVTVVERPSIASVVLEGNDALSTDQLDETLRSIGLVRGRIFKRAVLDKLETELRQAYFSRGQYGTTVDSTVNELDRNRVKVQIDITEGAVAKISHVNIVGNSAFTEQELLDQLESGVPGWNPFSTRDDYSQAKLGADTEKLHAWYLDRGYLQFNVTSTQVTISPDKRDINVTINVDEGEQYTVGKIDYSGDVLSIGAERLQALMAVQVGDIYSHKHMTQTKNAIEDRLGEDGYAKAEVRIHPDIDKMAKSVDLDFEIQPGKRFYVRRITFSGQNRTQDDVLRREMRQMEGSRYSPLALKRSRTRLQRLPYIESVTIDTPGVQGTEDLVDIDVTVNEGPSGSFGAGAGYGSDGFVFNLNFTQENLFGTGARLALSLDNSTSQKNFSLSYTDPYYTQDGISRNVRAFVKKTDTSKLSSTAQYILDSYGARVRYGVPMSEYSTFSFGLGYENVLAIDTPQSARDVTEFIRENGDEYDLFEINLGYTHDTRDRTVFATSGAKNSLNLEVTSPNSDLSYIKLGYSFEYFKSLSERYTLAFSSRINYGEGEEGLEELPFFRRYFAGGIQSVRGYRRNTLGPRDVHINEEGVDVGTGDALGGDFRTLGSLELIFPPPFVESPGATRLSVFTDFGNVFADVSDFDSSELRGSYGLAFVWLGPIGPLTFSVAETYNDDVNDSKQSFQFTIGSIF